MSSTAFPSLFAHVPAGAFGPLASPNRERYWRLLCRLFDEYFGPDAPLPPSHGFARREIVAALERYLLAEETWEDEGETPLQGGLAARAAAVYERLRQAGWLRQDKLGAREMVLMPPALARPSSRPRSARSSCSCSRLSTAAPAARRWTRPPSRRAGCCPRWPR